MKRLTISECLLDFTQT